MLANREAGSSAGGAEEAPPGLSAREEAPLRRPTGGLLSRLVDWKLRASRTFALFAAANATIWLLACSWLQVYCLLALLLALMVVMATVRDAFGSRSKGDRVWCKMLASCEIMDPDSAQDSGSELHLSSSLHLFLQETSAFKQQNPGKFCLLVCSFCTFFAVVGRYIPGIIISYFLVLSVFLWPVLSSPEASLWLKPVLQKLDFGVAALLRKIKEDHEKRILKAQIEESVESDLSSMFPKLDSAACKELSVSDTSVSEVTWTDNLNLSEENTPQTENSEDLDREEVFSGGLHDFPSVDNGATTNGDDDDDDDFGFPQPIGSQRAARLQPEAPHGALDLVQNAVRDAVAVAIQERMEAAVGFRLPKAADESDSEADDFELLDQAELDQLGAELDLLGGAGVKTAAEERNDKAPGFFAKLLRRH
ncbi:reticulophagy regulator 1 isoform X1 [Phyllopteryx taeniolatus]|uniref:reticulophagy regulator 1 isoform X1 n=1 Tax=Phyllopteryx taeniolatus TaxID=161469 RepID=UPI002AD3D0A0|nr:reticulophagy regulator 1 isoform X1 [Phyllopteryx taeniolatus]